MTRPRIVLDCDPGVDETFAIFTALRHCELVAITAVAGNVGVQHTTRNALAVVDLAGASTPVHRGASGPIDGREVDDARHVHGETGLGGVTLPEPRADVADGDAVDALLEYTRGGDVDLVAVGPLTNVALALRTDPTLPSRVPRLVIMGGSLDAGNVTAAAEFNIWADPEAAAIVFGAGFDLTMAGLNLTRQVQMGTPEIKRLRAGDTATARLGADALEFYADFSRHTYGLATSAMHDPCAVLDLVRPDLFERRRLHVAVETAGDLTRGMTLCDLRPNPAEANTSVLTAVAADTVVDLIVEAAIHPDPSA